ncbi:hypothetical protein F2Q69_00021412 [Brassica cretica]|uniref:Uncharacterized protein n=1 Tax=Brassica cretica TaxID=69181 RepID=A0A8S9QA83_BRACR|nr:hypothetical protein F2Q69_00021412 [Brassica cretica]
MAVNGCWRAPPSALPMTVVSLAYGAICLLFAPGRHSLCAFVLSGIDLGLEPELVVWIARVHKDEVILLLLHAGLLSAPAWVSQRFTMSFNVQAAFCFPLEVYQGTLPEKVVVRWSEPGIRNLEAGIQNLEAGIQNLEAGTQRFGFFFWMNSSGNKCSSASFTPICSK